MRQEIVSVADGFAVSEKLGNSIIVGQMIKFDNGIYKVNKIETLASEIVLLAIDVITAWVKWQAKQPVEHRVTRFGELHPDRDDLPDQDEVEWEIGLDGQPADPWKNTRYLRLVDPLTGADYTFVSDSIGGRIAVSDLKSQIRNVRYAHANAVPLVKLGTTTMKTKFGPKPRPIFRVVGWRGKKERAELTGGQSEQLKLASPSQAEFKDSIEY